MKFKLLDINLTEKTVGTMEIPAETIRKYIGGRGLGGRLLLDLLPGKVDPLGPENVMIWLAGPMTGSLVPGCTKHAVFTKSPQTNGFVDSYSSGGVGFQMVYAGYNGLIVRGKAQSPCYLYIRDDRVEIRDASHLWGLDSYEASSRLLKELGEEGFGHAAIGPAGENLVKFACINNDFYRQSARGGVGAVMGSKNLKALVVKGTGGVPCRDIPGFLAFNKQKLADAKISGGAAAHKRAGTAITFDATQAAGMLPTKNFQFGTFPPAADNLDSAGVINKAKASVACLGCPVPCGMILECTDSAGKIFRLEGPEYETTGLLGANLGISSMDAVAEANMLCDTLGMDTIAVGAAISFLMEANEKGMIPAEFAEQAGIAFGDIDGTLRLVKDIVYRQGIGEWAAEGVAFLASKIGQGSDRFAMHSKGLAFPAYDPRRAFGAGLAYAVSPRGACHRRAWPPALEVFGDVPPYTAEGKGVAIKGLYDERNILHSLIACDFQGFAVPVSLAEFAKYLRLVTDLDYSDEELAHIADRVETTIRMFNVREGMSRKDDTLPSRVLDDPMPDGPAAGQHITQAGLDRMLDDYYRSRGWDSNGIPTKETLAKYEIEEGLR
ncbi:MAG: aldehyde ferredoxin oxidoreductase family protein [Coprothermobacterota bacterium]|nr:aldehyde ferredoxin oxidoreductase family protein [Coprothermobacterota bacterium]